jgi:N-acetylmuramic acid 6-phosphate etherase
MDNKELTEQESAYNALETLDTQSILSIINEEDKTVALAVQQVLPSLADLVEKCVQCLQNGGRIFYIGAGTSGRLGILDASECPPTYGVDYNTIIGIIAGGDTAIRKAVEFAEDDTQQAWEDLQAFQVNPNDLVIGISASGKTPYVLGGLNKAKVAGLATACIVCNPNSPIAAASDFPIEVITGPEVVTGSTRMKAGTAQKMVLNMLTTASMIRLGKVKGNKMVDMKIANKKLLRRGVLIICQETGLNEEDAEKALQERGSVRAVIASYFSKS